MTEPTSKETEYRYNRLTWPEMNDAIARQPLVILPTGSTEQHGRPQVSAASPKTRLAGHGRRRGDG